MLSSKGFFVCSIYMFVGPALVLLNQYILKTLNFPYPIFLSGMGVLASGVFAQALVTFGVAKSEKPEAVQGKLWYKRVLPIGLCQAATLSFGNSVYLFLDVGFIQMLKAFTPVCILVTAYLAGIETPGVHLIIAVSIISIGMAITCGSAPDFHILGMTFMFLSTFSEAIKLVFTQFLLQNVKMGVIETQLVTSPAAAFWLFVASALCEFPAMYRNGALQIIIDFFPYFLGASGMGIGVNFISALVIQYTSSLTMKILNVGRNVMTIVIGVVFYAEVVSRKAVIGYLIMLVGFALFNAVKMGYLGETESAAQATSSSSNSHNIINDKPINAALPSSSARYNNISGGKTEEMRRLIETTQLKV